MMQTELSRANGSTIPEITNAFHPEHLADLQKSGLSLATIEAAGLYSVRPQDIPKLLGFNPPKVQSALVFPYPGTKDFCRLKVFPPFRDKDGHTVKYLQRENSGVHLYFPPGVVKILQTTETLHWTEGEKKALKLTQEGFPCIGLGGVWNWREKGQVIPALDQIFLEGRHCIIVPDSDTWEKDDVLRAVYAFGRELEQRGAMVSVFKLPQGQAGEKWGIDDYLVALDTQGIPAKEAMEKLQCLTLADPQFDQARWWYPGWRKRQGEEVVLRPELDLLLERLRETKDPRIAYHAVPLLAVLDSGMVDWIKAEIKGVCRAVDLRRLNAEITQAKRNVQAQHPKEAYKKARGSGQDLPAIPADDGDLPKVTQQAWDALLAANNPPFLFRYGGLPVRIEYDDKKRPIAREITPDRLRHVLARVAFWYRYVLDKKTKEVSCVPALPPMPVVKDVLAMPDLALPILTRIVEAPVFTPDGTIHTDPGYHPTGQIYYAPTPGFVLPSVPASPTPDDLQRARDLILSELLGDFPFVSDAERAHAVALLLLPFARDLIPGPTPLHLIEAPSAGTGKGLLAEVLLLPALGQSAAIITEGRDEEEWRKRITAILRNGPSVVLIDNLRRRLDSANVSAAITATTWEDRILGHSETVRLPVRCIWVATGNNPALSTEIARRTVRIRIDAKNDRPWNRDRVSFRHPDLPKWATHHRAELVWASLTLIQAWISQGRPGKTPEITLGRFESWSKTMGGILEVAGIPGFLENLDEFYDYSDAEGEMWRTFIDAWWDHFGDTPVGVKDLWGLLTREDTDLSLPLGEGNEKSQRIRLGKLLKANRDRQFAECRIVYHGKKQRADQWRLIPA
ncbi:MAG: DUF3854 domain-containing protein [Nitrospinota bacterium]|nr:MAG: DUF3854 domain-containing protein [Nitrospinota bacterium]